MAARRSRRITITSTRGTSTSDPAARAASRSRRTHARRTRRVARIARLKRRARNVAISGLGAGVVGGGAYVVGRHQASWVHVPGARGGRARRAYPFFHAPGGHRKVPFKGAKIIRIHPLSTLGR